MLRAVVDDPSSAPSVRGVITTRASRIRRAAAGPPVPVPAQGRVLAVARDVGAGVGGKRLDQDADQHGADGGAGRPVLHESHASRTRSDGAMSPITVADPASRS